MKRSAMLISFLLLLSCHAPLSVADLPMLNGYWEIDEVDAPDGTAKTYGVNGTVDYIELEGLNGFRKKVQPKLDGGYLASDDASFFKIREKEGRFYMSYHTDYATWEEELLHLDMEGFTVVNAENITYYYKRFEPISISP
jgi:hypothetical protein